VSAFIEKLKQMDDKDHSKRRALGRGLDALIPKRPEAAPLADGERIENIPVDQISPSRFQPRYVFNEDSIKELASSIKEKGVIQPIIVARKREGFELVAGERRWRAVKSLGLAQIPAIVKVVRDSDALELALIENIQRENLNPIEEASAYDRLMREHALTQESLSQRVGKNRSSIANFLRLLKLPDEIKDDIADGRLTMGHAKAILGLENDNERFRLRDQILSSGLNVRDVEERSRAASPKKHKAAPPKDVFMEDVRVKLERHLGSKVDIKQKAKGGQIIISYSDVDDFNRIIESLTKE